MTRIAEIADRLERLAKRREDEGIYTDASLCREASSLLLAPAEAGVEGDAKPVGEIVSVEGSLGDMHVIRWASGHTPKVGDKLYTHPSLLEECRKVLRPLAALAGAGFYVDESGRELNATRPDDQPVWGFNRVELTYGHLRRCRAILTKLEAGR